jgi:hypothetical protein
MPELVTQHSRAFAALAWSLALVMTGCGQGNRPPVAHLHGGITIDGRPLPADAAGRIFFTPAISSTEQTAPPAVADIVNGEYGSHRVPVGQVNVTFDIKRPTGRKIPRGTSVPLEELQDLVPAKYRDGTMITVEQGEATRDFEL